MTDLITKLEERSARVVVSGGGYIGLPLALELSRAGFAVTVLDPDRGKLEAIARGKSYVEDVEDTQLAAAVQSGRLRGAARSEVLGGADVVVICVPTPLDDARRPDISHIGGAVDEIARHQHAGMLVALESTTYPGTTEELLVPRLGARFAVGEDVFIAYSPERTDPGNRSFGIRNTPKVVAGVTPACLRAASTLYETVADRVVPVSTTTTAELVKLLENTFRGVNIGLVNEFAVLARRLGVDPFELVEAASTKPFGFMPFYPGPGVGGHCIAVDPRYLAWKAAEVGVEMRFAEVAEQTNRAMPPYVVRRLGEVLGNVPLEGAKVLVYGVTYKRDVADVRESPGIAIIDELLKHGVDVAYMDPLVDEIHAGRVSLRSVPHASSFASYDVVLVVTDHRSLDRERLLREARLVVDTRNALAGARGSRAHVHGL